MSEKFNFKINFECLQSVNTRVHNIKLAKLYNE